MRARLTRCIWQLFSKSLLFTIVFGIGCRTNSIDADSANAMGPEIVEEQTKPTAAPELKPDNAIVDDFSTESLDERWSTATLVAGESGVVEGASIAQENGFVTITNPAAAQGMQELQLYTEAFPIASFESSVEFRMPEGDAMAYFCAREPGASNAPFEQQIFCINFYGIQNQYDIFRRLPGGQPEGRLGRQSSKFNDEQTNWHELKLEYDAATGMIRALVDDEPLVFVGDNFGPGEIELCFGLLKFQGAPEANAQVQFDNFRLRQGKGAKAD